jgi:hypothetical protein
MGYIGRAGMHPADVEILNIMIGKMVCQIAEGSSTFDSRNNDLHSKLRALHAWMPAITCLELLGEACSSPHMDLDLTRKLLAQKIRQAIGTRDAVAKHQGTGCIDAHERRTHIFSNRRMTIFIASSSSECSSGAS